MACRMRTYVPGKVPLAFLLLLDFMSGANFGISLTNLSDITLAMYDKAEPSIINAGESSRSAIVSALTSAFLIGSMIGSMIITHVADYYGRKITSIACCFLASFFNFLAMVPVHWVYLLIIRIIIGVPSAGLTTTIPMWLAELAIPKDRGILNVLFQLFVTVGIILGYIMILAYRPTDAYWGGFLLPALFFLVGLIACFCVPETGNVKYKSKCKKPANNGAMDFDTDTNDADYEKIENQLNIDSNPVIDETTNPKALEEALKEHSEQKEEVMETIENQNSHKKEEESLKPVSVGWKDLANKKYAKCLIIAVLLPICQQGCGINTVIMYAQTIFNGIGSTEEEKENWKIYGSIIISVLNFLFTIISIFLIERVGRRRLFIVSYIITAIGLGVFIAYYCVWGTENNDDQQSSPAQLSVLIIAAVIFLLGFELFLGPGFYVLCAESFPKIHRSRLNGISFTLNWVVNLIVVFTYPYFPVNKQYTAFIMYLVLSLISFVPSYIVLPETKGKSLDEIEKIMVGESPKIETDMKEVLIQKSD